MYLACMCVRVCVNFVSGLHFSAHNCVFFGIQGEDYTKTTNDDLMP